MVNWKLCSGWQVFNVKPAQYFRIGTFPPPLSLPVLDTDPNPHPICLDTWHSKLSPPSSSVLPTPSCLTEAHKHISNSKAGFSLFFLPIMSFYFSPVDVAQFRGETICLSSQISVERLQPQELHTPGHVVTIIKKQRARNACMLGLTSLSPLLHSPGSPP